MERDSLREFNQAGTLRRKIKITVLLVFSVLLGVPWMLSQTAVKAQYAPGTGASAAPGGKNSCVECHSQMGDQLAAPIAAIQDDVHSKRGLSCADCHGGDPAEDDPERAMNPQKGFVARPKPADVPRFCGKCHSNAEFMKKFNPSLRVDQEAEYYTSIHGKLVKQGDQKPATCISCHGFHGVKAVSDPNAPVYPLNVAQTCGQCHASDEYMKGYSIATDQAQKYATSVHADALSKKQDLSAPTCNDCHGNHGAAPPGVTSVAFVCGACHTRQSDLFQKSPHRAPFEAAGIAGCVVCHSNHEIHAPTDEMLGVNEKATCVSCHTEGDAGYQAAGRMRARTDDLKSHIDQARQQLNKAAYAGMEVSRPLFDLKDSEDKLINARVVIHSSSPEELEAAVAPGLEAAIKAHQEGDNALAELQFRRKGLAASLVIIFLAGLAIYLKIRQLKHSNL